MLTRFSLYGFLKNQKYYEPFIILALRDKGLSFLMIGLLVGFRQVWVNIMEVPSGLIADTFGRRRSMIASFIAYIISFIIFAASGSIWTLFSAMFFFAIGEAFRTGTHKAMIFDWLATEGRVDEKTQVYGYTRSWSQIGSAVSVIIATAAVLISENYTTIFWLSILPYAINIVNFLSYPKWLDRDIQTGISLGDLWRKLVTTISDSLRNRPLRRTILESMTYKGNATLTKDYLQPLLNQMAFALPILIALSDERRSAILVGSVFFLLHLVSSIASRKSHRIAGLAGGVESASTMLWAVNVLLFAVSIIGIWRKWDLVAAGCFVLVVILQNIWRPILLSRIDNVSDAEMGATILSLDSQAGSFYVMIFAPLLGLAVDRAGLWPVGAFGGLMALLMLLKRKSGKNTRRSGSSS